MPYLENFTDATGTTHVQAFIAITSVNIDWGTRQAFLVLNVYKDGTAWMEGRRPVDTRVAILGPEPNEAGKTFEDFFNLVLLADPTFNPIQALESHLADLPILENATLISF